MVDIRRRFLTIEAGCGGRHRQSAAVGSEEPRPDRHTVWALDREDERGARRASDRHIRRSGLPVVHAPGRRRANLRAAPETAKVGVVRRDPQDVSSARRTRPAGRPRARAACRSERMRGRVDAAGLVLATQRLSSITGRASALLQCDERLESPRWIRPLRLPGGTKRRERGSVETDFRAARLRGGLLAHASHLLNCLGVGRVRLFTYGGTSAPASREPIPRRREP
jgi:hypothetical protein